MVSNSVQFCLHCLIAVGQHQMHSSQDSFPLPAHRHGWEEGKESVILEENKNNAYLK